MTAPGRTRPSPRTAMVFVFMMILHAWTAMQAGQDSDPLGMLGRAAISAASTTRPAT